MAREVLPRRLPAERRQRGHAGQPAQLAVEPGEGPEVAWVAAGLDGDQLAVLAGTTQHGLPLADAGQADGVLAVREDGEPDVVLGRGVRQVAGQPVQ